MSRVAMIPYQPIGAHTATDLTAAVLAPTIPSNADGILAQATGGNVRFRIDGTDPDATTGFQLLDGGQPVLIPIAAGTVVKFIREGAAARLQHQFVVTG